MTKVEIFGDVTRPNKKTDQAVVKGKRTKRPRPPPSSSTSSSGGGSFDYHHSNSQSPSSSSTCTITDQEDEDVANCLILLSHGGSGNNQEDSNKIKATQQRSTSRKFTELTPSDAKVGIYVYECKTCNRSFPSFQALGGHRASHKKPKPDNIGDTLKCPEVKKSSAATAAYVDAPSVVKKSREEKDSNNKAHHECSICGSVFGSGQALGGHMRRHRSTLNNINNKGNNNNTSTASLEIASTVVHDSSSHDVCDEKQPRNNNNLLSLDLNLPAPTEDEVFLSGAAVDGGLRL